MVKHTQTIRGQFANELIECVWPFCGIGAERVNNPKTAQCLMALPPGHPLGLCLGSVGAGRSSQGPTTPPLY